MTDIIGTVFLNRFRVDAFVAAGGMGAVYRAWDLERNVTLAMKVLHAESMDDPGAFKYFQREARALEKLRHPNIVPFYGIYQTEDFAFFLEHYIDGPSLHSILRKKTDGLPIPEVLGYLQALCSALGYAHAKGVVHCDIKPGNVMLDRGGQIYLTDFGIARHAEGVTMTIAGAGTPAYMAPEQVRAEAAVTPATDIYSLGILMFEMLTGQRPFRGDEAEILTKGNTTGERIRYAHLHLPPPNPIHINPNIPSKLALIILKCLLKDPMERYQSASELFSALAMLDIPSASPEAQIPLMAGAQKQQFPQFQQRQPNVKKIEPDSVSKVPIMFFVGIGAAILLVGGLVGAVVVSNFFGNNTSIPPELNLPAESTITSNLIAPSTEPVSSTDSTPTINPPETPTAMPETVMPLAGTTAVSSTDGMTLVYVPRGEFLMGAQQGDSQAGKDESPQHAVYLDAFWVDKYEVTNAMFLQFVKSTNYQTQTEVAGWSWDFDGQNWSQLQGTDWLHPINASSNIDGLENHPVVRVSHADAQAYCQWAGRRLLTEAEWEKAARSEDGRAYPWGNQFSCGNANFGESGCDPYVRTAPVASFPSGASPYSALDMAGNVWEWVSDWYQEDYYQNAPYNNPQGPGSGKGFVMRGGSWSSEDSRWFRASWREWGNENDSYWSTGFRCSSSNAP